MVEPEFVDDAGDGGTGAQRRLEVSAHRSSPDRMVLVEAGNADGWIAFDADVAASIER